MTTVLHISICSVYYVVYSRLVFHFKHCQVIVTLTQPLPWSKTFYPLWACLPPSLSLHKVCPLRKHTVLSWNVSKEEHFIWPFAPVHLCYTIPSVTQSCQECMSVWDQVSALHITALEEARNMPHYIKLNVIPAIQQKHEHSSIKLQYEAFILQRDACLFTMLVVVVNCQMSCKFLSCGLL